MSEVSVADDDTATDAATPVAPLFQVVKGNPSDEELAALVTVLASASGGGAPETGDRNDWGHPVSKLRYAYTSWQLVTLVERTFIRR